MKRDNQRPVDDVAGALIWFTMGLPGDKLGEVRLLCADLPSGSLVYLPVPTYLTAEELIAAVNKVFLYHAQDTNPAQVTNA